MADNASFDPTYRQPLSVEQIQIVYNEPISTPLEVRGDGTNTCYDDDIIQISSDNFSSCLPLQADESVDPLGTPDNITWTFNVIPLENNENCPIAPKGPKCRARFEDNTTYTARLLSMNQQINPSTL